LMAAFRRHRKNLVVAVVVNTLFNPNFYTSKKVIVLADSNFN